jgi:hypothetical protein
VPIFQQSVDACLYEWLLAEQKRRKARTVQDVIRQVLREAEAEAEKHVKSGCSQIFALKFGEK